MSCKIIEYKDKIWPNKIQEIIAGTHKMHIIRFFIVSNSLIQSHKCKTRKNCIFWDELFTFALPRVIANSGFSAKEVRKIEKLLTFSALILILKRMKNESNFQTSAQSNPAEKSCFLFHKRINFLSALVNCFYWTKLQSKFYVYPQRLTFIPVYIWKWLTKSPVPSISE